MTQSEPPPVRLESVVEVSAAVAATSSRKAKVALIADLLQRCAVSEVATAGAYLSGVVPQGRLGVGWRSLATPPPPAAEPSLLLAHVDEVFADLAVTAGPGSTNRRRDLLAGLLSAATAAEQDFLRRLITGELRQGALDAVMLQAIAVASGVGEEVVRRAAMLAGSVVSVAVPALTGGAEALERIRLRVGTPILPMLAGSAPDVATAMGDPGPKVVERKLDGIRVQVHREGDGVQVFSRSLEDLTARLPEVVETVSALECRAAILDGEVLALTPDGRPEPFQITGARTASHVDPAGQSERVPLTAWFFDVLHLDGDDLLDEPLSQRRERLSGLLADRHRVPGIVTDDPIEADRWFARTVAEGHEGVLVKDPDAPYAAGRRGSGWVKVKPRHTVDLVVLAVEPGSGRRRGWLSNIHLGARDPATGELVMVGKTFKGMTDDMLRWQTERFTELMSERDDWVVRLRPEQVVEIAFDGVQRSRRYPGGVALRFARVLRYRDDKPVTEVDTIDSLRALAGLA
ncbi:ATP-dependent DNA ligase [Ammonicoccus fulvus]|uniref:Probable DNA ligase n=1 Tax=Ammonicoccus fulvus TaxID=3138240 RepID=A0ABZ3FKV8_9ACTN